MPPDAIEGGSGRAGPESQAQADPAAESSAAGGGDAQPAARQPLSRPGDPREAQHIEANPSADRAPDRGPSPSVRSLGFERYAHGVAAIAREVAWPAAAVVIAASGHYERGIELLRLAFS